jgi:quinol monooxygenase YgiN
VGDLFGAHVEFTARPGLGDDLEAVLLEAAERLNPVDACWLYLVSRSPTVPETVWVTEAWTSVEAHDESLKDDSTRALVQRAIPLMAGQPNATELRPAGGKIP